MLALFLAICDIELQGNSSRFEMENEMTEVLIGDRVRWECTYAGTFRGEVIGFIERTRFNETWTNLEIEFLDGRLTELNCSEENLKAKNFKIIFRDGGFKAMQTEQEVAV